MGEMERPDPAQLRISDEDRHKVAEILRQAAGEGRLDLEELDERLEAAYAAKTYADLVPITIDLPTAHRESPELLRHGSGVQPPALPVVRHGGSFALMTGQTRKGLWEISELHQAVSVMGGITLDLREARFPAQEVVINAVAVMGAVDIYVNARTRISVEGVGIMGAFEEGRHKVDPDYGPDSPLVRVRGLALMGGVTVVRKPMPGEGRRPGKRMLGH